MKLSDDDLKRLWQQDTAHVEDSRTDCLSSDFLVRAGEGTLDAEERARVAGHLAHCADCAEEYRLAVAVKDWAPAAAATHADAFTTKPAVTNAKEPWWRTWFTMPNLKAPALAMTGLALLMLGWFVWRVLNKVQPEIALATPTPAVTATPLASPSATPTVPLVVQLQDGQQLVALNQQGELSGVDHLPPAYQQMVKDALTKQRVERSPLLAGLSQQASSLRGGDEQGNTFALTEPIGKVVLADRPVFRWSPLAGATGYAVEIYDNQFNLVIASLQLSATSWTASQSLKRDKIYSWQVKASKDGQEFKAPGPNAPQATFRILSQAKTNELVQARRAYGSSHLTLGLIYAQAGLLDEAEAEFRTLQKANPHSPIARQLLTTVRTLRR